MKSLYDQIAESVAYIRKVSPIIPSVGVVLGTGLGCFAETIKNKIEIPYSDIPYFPISTVESHSGKLVIGYKGKTPIVVMSGRFHYYEGYTAAQLTFPIRVLKSLGISQIFLTNAAGGINPHYEEGDIVMVTDHINMMPDHPLRGSNDDRLGPRFPDMLHAYDADLQQIFTDISGQIGIKLHKGIYLGLQGPSLETPAEYKMARILGADVLGMSTIPEVIVAKHAGLKVAVFSIATNKCFPKSIITETTLEEVIDVVNGAASHLQKLLDAYFENI